MVVVTPESKNCQVCVRWTSALGSWILAQRDFGIFKALLFLFAISQFLSQVGSELRHNELILKAYCNWGLSWNKIIRE